MSFRMAAVVAACLCLVGSVEAGRQRCRVVSSRCSAPSCECSPCECQPGRTSRTAIDIDERSRTVTACSAVDCEGGVCRSRTVTTTRSRSTAQGKADQLAARGQLIHLGGSFGGGSYEGIGFGLTADQATRSCCDWGQRTPIEIGVAQGASGWYAVVLYR